MSCILAAARIHANRLFQNLSYTGLHRRTITEVNDNDIFKVISFNVLATCYALSSYSTYLTYCSKTYLNGEHRFSEIGNILKKCNADIICLQEIDNINDTLKWMDLSINNNNKYKITYEKRTNLKQDGLLLAYNKNMFIPYNNMDFECISLNDLCLGCSSTNSQTYYQKDQIAIYILLQSLHNPNNLIFIVNTHLYWHPNADDIRLSINSVLNDINHTNKNISLIFCGDFNSLPDTAPYSFILNGEYTMKAQGNSPLKLIVDCQLNKVSRWCRALGIDCAYFSEENITKTEIANKLFERCLNEDRILITRSKRLCERNNCPKHLLLSNNNPIDNIKEIIKYFGCEYNIKSIYTRCSLCNGLFRRLNNNNDIINNTQIPDAFKPGYTDSNDVKLDANGDPLTFFECLDCFQIYWYGNKSEIKLEKLKQIYKEIDNELNKETQKEQLNELIKYLIKTKQKQIDIDRLDQKLKLLPNLQRFFWDDVTFINPLGKLNDSYKEINGRNPEYTNKIDGFHGCLDYIFYSDLHLSSEKRLMCIDSKVIEGNKEYYPNNTWPSDHVLLTTTFNF